jgi:hypothetical protein
VTARHDDQVTDAGSVAVDDWMSGRPALPRRERLSLRPTVFEPGQPVSGRVWGSSEHVAGWYQETWGTDGAILVELVSGERVSIAPDSVEPVGRHRAELLLPESPDRVPLPSPEEPTEETQWLDPVVETVIEATAGTLDEPVVRLRPLRRAARWFMRNLTGARMTVLVGVVGVLAGSGIGWWVR